ncbi:MAG: CbtB-domain containing protein [Saccharospirillaceae bacterium]|nr:CbtB-domain containing protein [Pseudomonadales bacterium]NRB79720.1 CbtB-domain containing protein [Saccharospirillaceae bacterium]
MTSITNSNNIESNINTSSVSSTLPSVFGALIIGALFIFAVGFSNMSVAHNSAHDTRHVVSFPCH